MAWDANLSPSNERNFEPPASEVVQPAPENEEKSSSDSMNLQETDSKGNESRPNRGLQSDNLPDAPLLESVLRQTLEVCETEEVCDAAEMTALREVAARYRGRALDWDPVAIELVEAAMGSLGPLKLSREACRSISVQVARVLLDDPVTFARLNAFWIRLGGEGS